jgi:hypothetical protein
MEDGLLCVLNADVIPVTSAAEPTEEAEAGVALLGRVVVGEVRVLEEDPGVDFVKPFRPKFTDKT